MHFRPSKTRGAPGHIHLILYGLLTGLIIGIASLAAVLLHDGLRAGGEAKGVQINGSAGHEFDGTIVIDPPFPVPDHGLTNAHNELLRLSQLRGQYVLLTFGFTHCPDVCPMTLNDFLRIQAQLGQEADHTQFVFVSVDGVRDTPAALRDYFALREIENVIALTGSEEEVRAFGAAFGLAFEISGETMAGGYLVNHTAGSFLLDRDGRWIMRFQFGVPPETVAAELRQLLRA